MYVPSQSFNVLAGSSDDWTRLKDDSFNTVTISKVVTSATENSLMPLVQLSLLFPNIIQLFPKEPLDTSDLKGKNLLI